MFGHSFYHGALRKYIIMFGNMFNDLEVGRYNNSGQLIQSLQVPISYGPKEKFLARLRQDPGLDKQFATVLPRLSFEILNVSYDAGRSFNKMNRLLSVTDGGNQLKTQFTPTPYDIDIALYGMFANNEDAVQVVEQILPFFRPEWTHSIKITSDMPDYFDVSTILNDMSIEDTYEADFDTRRAIIYTFNFTIKGYMFGPVQNKGVIKRTKVTAIVDEGQQQDRERVTTTPAQYANGLAATSSNLSRPISQIDANTNYGFAFDIENYFDIINRRVEIGADAAPVEVDPFANVTPRFALSVSPATAQEGENVANTAADTLTFSLEALGVRDRTKLPWTITGVSDDDITRNLTGYFTILDQAGTIEVPIKKDFLTEGPETLTLTLDNGQANVSVLIRDTSIDRKFFLTSPQANTTIVSHENTPIYFNLRTEQVADNTNLQLVSDNFPVANLNGSTGAISTSSGNNEFRITNGQANLIMNIETSLRTEAGSRLAKFYIKGFDNFKNEANIAFTVTDPGFPEISMGSQQITMNAANITHTVSLTNTYDLEPIEYRIDTILEDLPANTIVTALTGTILANNGTNTSELEIVPANTAPDYLDRYFDVVYQIPYTQITDANTVGETQVATNSNVVKFVNPIRPAGAKAYSIMINTGESNSLEVEGYDTDKVSSPYEDMNIDSSYATVNMEANSSILYMQINTIDLNIYISEFDDHDTNNVITNTAIVLNQGANTGQIIFAPKETGTYYYWNHANTDSVGTINVSLGNNEVSLPITPE